MTHLPDRSAASVRRPAQGARAGFTLIEVVLAIGIAVGIFMVLLYFYKQAADLRTQLLQEADRLSTMRLLMDRLTSELRTARRHGSEEPLFGDAHFIQFLKTDVSSRVAWASGRFERAALAESDVKRVTYNVKRSQTGTNTVVAGLTRREDALVAKRKVPEPGGLVAPEEKQNKDMLVTEEIRFLRLRYWDGVEWLESWSGVELPQGVEISLGVEPLPEDTEPTDYPYEIFRRVVQLYDIGSALDKSLVSSTPDDPFAEVVP